MSQGQGSAGGHGVMWWWLVLALVMTAFGVVASREIAGRADFRAFYAAGHIVREAPAKLYDLEFQREVEDRYGARKALFMPFYHPAYEALVYAGFSPLSFSAAYVLYLELQLGLILLLRRMAPAAASKAVSPGIATVLFFTSAPVLLTMVYGQDSLLFLLVLFGVMRALDGENDVAAGCLLGLGVFRPQLAIPIAVALSVRVGWKFLLSFAGVAGVLTALSALLVGWRAALGFGQLLTRATVAVNQDAGLQKAMVVYPGTMPNLHGLVYTLGGYVRGASVGDALTLALSAGVFVAGVLVVRRSKDVRSGLGVAVLTAMLVSYHLHLYEFCLLLLPMMVLSGKWHGWLVAAGYVVPFVLQFAASTHLALAAPLLLLFFGYEVWRTLRSRPPVVSRWSELAAT